MDNNVLLEKAALRELVDTFSNLEIDVHSQMSLFTKNTKVKVYMGNQLAFDISGVEELEKTFSMFTKNVKSSHHMNGQFVVDVKGNNANGTLYCIATLVSEENGKKHITVNNIYYHDTYIKIDGKWLIETRESHFSIIDKRELVA